MREHTVFQGSYRGIAWSINRTKTSDSMKEYSRRDFDWCHYIHLSLEQLPEESREQFWLSPKPQEMSVSKRKYVSYDYWDSIISSLEFHGGCTFYEKVSGVDGSPRVVKIGCDYQHLWDDGQNYSVNSVLFEVKESIDSLHALIPGIGVHCWHGYCGEPFHKESDGIYQGDKESFICLFCEGKRQKELQETKSPTAI